MKKYISYLLASALLAPVFVSCSERLQEGEIPVRTHKVFFTASQAETRTGLSVEGKTVTPDWNKTLVENVHLFETDANDATVYGETLNIVLGENNETAQFEADFPEEMTIAVGANASDDPGQGGAAARVAPFRYAAVIAPKAAGQDLAFAVPAEQHPDAATLKDPDADFLIGYSAQSYDDPHNYDEPVVDLFFDRAAALGRLAVSNFSDGAEKVRSVTISTAAGLTGSAAFSQIDFENAAVTFDRAEGPLTLVYDGAEVPAEGPFYAYFVAIPGEAEILSVEVVTDQFRYTKAVGKTTTFSTKTFKSLSLDLSTAEKEAVAPAVPAYVKVTSTDDLEVGAQYLVVFEGLAGDTDGDGDPKVFDPVLDSETQFKKHQSAALDVTITDSTIESDEFEDCQFTLEEGYFLKANKAGKYLYPVVSSSRGYIYAEDTPTNALNITFTNSGIAEIITKTGTYYLVWSTSSHYFSANEPIEGSYSTGICLYKLDDGRLPQSFAFTQPTVEYDFDEGGDFPEPAFTVSPVGDVTYSSDNEAVAVVDPSTGEVTVLKAGTAVITARAAGNDKYRAHSASYTIHSNTSKIQKWVKADEIEDGEEYLVVSNGYLLQNNSGSTAAEEVEVNDGVILYNAPENTVWTAAATSSSGKYTLANGSQNLYRSSSTTLTLSSSSSSSWSYDSGNDYVTTAGSSSTYYLYYSTSNSRWSLSTSTSSTHVATLYKLDDGRLPQEMAFTAEEAEYDLATGTWTKACPTVSGYQTTPLSWTSSNESVATVDADGNVAPKAKGTTTITVTAPGNSTYKSGSASYKVIVTNSNVPKYIKADEAEDGEQYLIVSNGYALQNNNSSTAGALAVEVVDGVISLDAPSSALWTATESSGKFTFKNDTRSLYRSSSSIRLDSSNSSTWTYDAANDYLTTQGSSSTYYFYYSTSNSSFSASTSQSSSHVATLYVLDNGLPRAQKLAFSASSASFNINGKTTPVSLGSDAPTLSGAKTTVDYTSSDPSVASVDASGSVSVKKTGTTTISAKAQAGTAGGKEYAASNEVSYTLTVIDVLTPTMGSAESSVDLRVSSSTIVQELSGLCLSKDGDFLWGVGDKGTLYKINFDGTASTQWTDQTNMEGLAMDPATGTMYMCFEPNSVYTLTGDYTSKTLLWQVEEASSMNNDGVEGVAWADGYLYLGAQTNATLWKYNVNGTKLWTKQLGDLVPSIQEVAGLDYDMEKGWLWVVDSVNKMLFLFDSEVTVLLASYDLSSIASENPEGVCVDRNNNCIWICEDYSSSRTPSKLHKISFANLSVD